MLIEKTFEAKGMLSGAPNKLFLHSNITLAYNIPNRNVCENQGNRKSTVESQCPHRYSSTRV